MVLYFILWEAVHHGTDAARLVQHLRLSSADHGGKAGAALPVRAVFAAAAGRRVHRGAAGVDDGGYCQCAGFYRVSKKVPAGGNRGEVEVGVGLLRDKAAKIFANQATLTC